MTRNRRTGELFVPPHPAVLGVARIRCDSRDAERELRGGGRGGGEGGVNRRSGVLGMCDESGRNWRGREGGREGDGQFGGEVGFFNGFALG